MIRYIIAKIVFFFYYRFDILRGNDGTAYPGRLLLKLCPDFNKRILEGIDCILVAGTNGKSTTTKMIATLLEANGIRCVYTFEGSNMYFSIASSLARQISIFNKHKIDKAVIECDEPCLKEMAKVANAKVIVVTTIDVDHGLTYSSVDVVANLIKEGIEIAKDAVICINPSNEYNKVIRELPDRKYIYYKMIDDYALVDDEKFKIKLVLKGKYNIENAAAALSVAKALSLLNDKSINAISNMEPVYGRFETIIVNKCYVTMDLIQNPIGTKVVFDEIFNNDDNKERILFLGLLNASEYSIRKEMLDFIDFKLILEKYDKVYVLDNHEIINEYLDGKGINIDYDEMLKIVENIDEPVMMVLWYDGMMKARGMFANKKYVKSFYLK